MTRAEAMQYAGAALIVAGVAFVFWPAALIVSGLALAILAEAEGR